MKGLGEAFFDESVEPDPDLFAPEVEQTTRRKVWKTAALAVSCLAALVVLAIYFLPGEERFSESYATDASGIENVTLADSSVVELNASSRVEVALTDRLRTVRLVEGEAHFQVAKDQSRPFLVEVGEVTVRAVGTAFNVRHSDEGVEVLVTEGLVELISGQGSGKVSRLGAGALAWVKRGAGELVPAVRSVDVEEMARMLAWKGVRLKFEEVTLEEAIARFNEANALQVVIADESLKSRRIGGSFLAADLEGFLRLLRMDGSVVVEQEESGVWVLRTASE